MRRALRYGLLGALVAFVAVATVPTARIAPLVRDDLTLDRIVVAVALDWRDLGLATARERLQYELDARGVGAQVTEQDCALTTEPDEVRSVACAWDVDVTLPLLEQPVTLSFRSAARVDRHGVLLR